jgi:hypothetical protein
LQKKAQSLVMFNLAAQISIAMRGAKKANVTQGMSSNNSCYTSEEDA